MNLKDNEEFLEDLPSTAELELTLEALHGQDRFAARKRVVEMMEAGGFLEKVEPHKHVVPHGDRGGVPSSPS